MSQIKEIDGKYYEMTINKDFVDTALELKRRGNKNWYFMLEIKNPEVADIDPFKIKLTKREILLFVEECKQNIWWFMRIVARQKYVDAE